MGRTCFRTLRESLQAAGEGQTQVNRRSRRQQPHSLQLTAAHHCPCCRFTLNATESKNLGSQA